MNGGVHVRGPGWTSLKSPSRRFWEAAAGLLWAQSAPEWPHLAPGSCNICLPSSCMQWSAAGFAPSRHCHASLGLLLLLRAEVSTVARLSFVSYISQHFFSPTGK